MDKKSVILFYLLLATVVAAIAFTYYRVAVRHDYIVAVEIDCDPIAESCFVYECDPAEDETCSDDPDERIYYYKIINKNARNIPVCQSDDGDCPALFCAAGEADCEVIFCDADTVGEGEACSDMAGYQSADF